MKANEKYGNKITSTTAKHTADLTEQYFRELQSAPALTTNQSFKKLFYDAPIGFYENEEVGVKLIPPRDDQPKRWGKCSKSCLFR